MLRYAAFAAAVVAVAIAAAVAAWTVDAVPLAFPCTKTGQALVVSAVNVCEGRKKWHEGSVAKAQKQFIQNHLPELAAGQKRALESTVSLNETLQWEAMEQTSIMSNIRANVEARLESIADNTTIVADSAKRVAQNSDAVTKNIHDIRIINNSLVDRVAYRTKLTEAAILGLAIKVYEGMQALKKIGEKLDNINTEMKHANSIQVQGSGGENGFAQHVYDYVEMRTKETAEESSGKHMFFVYHPDTDWHATFRRMIARNPLPATFCAKSNDLDQLCILMQTVRKALVEASDDGKHVVFHLLIPAWSPITILKPLHFPDELQPFHIESLTHQGKPHVTFNLPAAPSGLLRGVRNLLDPEGWNTIGAIAGGATWMVGGSVLNGGCLALGMGAAALTGLGLLAVVPIWWGGSFCLSENGRASGYPSS